MKNKPIIDMRVAGGSNAGSLGGAIAGELRRGKMVHLYCIGAQASYAAVKGLCAAQEFVADEGGCLVCQPEFVALASDQGARPGVRIKVWVLE